MISVSFILTIIAIVIVLAILFKLFKVAAEALGVPDPWRQLAYWVLVLIVVVWALGYLGVMQPIVR